LIKDVQGVCERFGTENVILENNYSNDQKVLRGAYLPEVFSSVIEETGCGFLFDISHARLAAKELKIDPKEYMSALPVRHIKEIHLTGLQTFDEGWEAHFREAGEEEALIQKFLGRYMDHFALEEADWEVWDWALGQLKNGDWAKPWAVTVEYGGVGSFWGTIVDEAKLIEMLPRLWRQLQTIR
jgi:uncharacterized protein (UPF0276 family)